MSGDKPAVLPAPPAPTFLGALVRDLRQAAGLSRKVFSEQLGIISDCDLRRFEFNRTVLTKAQLARLYSHPAMAMLPKLAAAAGIEPPKGGAGSSET